MTPHTLAIVLFVAVVFQIGCVLGVETDPRPWTPQRKATVVAGIVVFVAAIWLAVDAL